MDVTTTKESTMTETQKIHAAARRRFDRLTAERRELADKPRLSVADERHAADLDAAIVRTLETLEMTR